MECPVCLEELTGTVVQLGCCKNQVHIQCYLQKCPLCRADLPMPNIPEPPPHIIVPIPTQQPRTRLAPALGTSVGVAVLLIFILIQNIP
jgi:hypothetical protein